MTTRKNLLIATLGLGASAAAFAACGTDVKITAETTGSSHASSTSNTSSSGSMSSSSGTMMGGTGGASSASSSTGGPPPAQKLVTAETDIAQYQSFTVSVTSSQQGAKVLDGPFFVTDVAGSSGPGGSFFFLVTNGDCSGGGQSVLNTNVGPNAFQVHGIRMPVLPGQTLCVGGAGATGIVMGFRPY